MFLPHFDVLCDLLLNRYKATWNLFVLYNKETNYYSFIFQNLSSFLESRRFSHFNKHEKRCNPLSIQNETISLVAMCRKGLWLVQENHPTVNLDSNGFLWNENSQQKQNWTAKSTNLEENAGKFRQFLSRAALWAKKLGCCREYRRSWKNTLGKLAVAVNTEGHLIRVLNERSVGDRWWQKTIEHKTGGSFTWMD